MLKRIWDSKFTLVALVLAYLAIEFWAYSRDMREDRADRVREEVSEKVSADLAEKRAARQEKLMQDIKALKVGQD